MKIKNHRLYNDDNNALPFKQSPNMGGTLQHKFLVMHFTAGRNAAESVNWLTNKSAKASAHVVIGRDGGITQLIPFDRVAWHAGASSWEAYEGLNSYSIGIELDNAGRLSQHGERWQAWFGDDYDNADVIQATHKNESTPCGWQVYTPLQIEAALTVGGLLMSTYKLQEVLGHDDIAPHRKCDPGPAFPMASFRSRLQGRGDDLLPRFRTTTDLNIRSGPGTGYPCLPDSPLPTGTSVQALITEGTWWKVDVLETGSRHDLDGWVHSRFLERQ